MANTESKDPQRAPRSDLARTLLALADPIRLRMLKLMSLGAFSPGQLAQLLGIAEKTASKHLIFFRESKLVAARTQNNVKYYRLRGESECPYFRLIALAMDFLEVDPVMRADVAVYKSLHAENPSSGGPGERFADSNQVSTACLGL